MFKTFSQLKTGCHQTEPPDLQRRRSVGDVAASTEAYLDELWLQVDGAKPVPEVWVAVQGLGPLRLGHLLLALQLLTDVFHQLYLQGATEAKRRS